MTSLRQIESNRHNALRSTGPKTKTGKQRSSQNAIRHGLTAETVVGSLEDPEDYKAFEQAVTADYDAETAVERELIETGLLQIQSEVLREQRMRPAQTPSQGCILVAASRIGRSANVVRSLDACSGDYSINSETVTNTATKPESRAPEPRFDIAQYFLRLSNLDNNVVFERLGRYEMALWRQVRQAIFTLERLRWRSSARGWPSWQQMTGIPLAASAPRAQMRRFRRELKYRTNSSNSAIGAKHLVQSSIHALKSRICEAKPISSVGADLEAENGSSPSIGCHKKIQVSIQPHIAVYDIN